MKKFLVPLILIMGLVAAACNGHGALAKAQAFTRHGYDFIHNHDAVDADTVRGTVIWAYDSGSEVVDLQLCLTWAHVDANNDPIASGEKCSSPAVRLGTGSAAIQVDKSVTLGSGESLHAYNSRVIIYRTVGGTTTYDVCRYHLYDGDPANPSFCPARDANGDL